MSAESRVHAAAAELYGGTPAQFVARRSALVKAAREAKDREAAKDVAALRKPSGAAWALNQVVRRCGEVVALMRHLGVRLRHAQSTLDAAGLAALRAERDEALATLVSAARELCADEGQTLTEAVEREVRDTAIAALADAAAEEVAWSGVLTRGLSYAGFGEVDIADAVAQTSTGVVLARIEGGRAAATQGPDGGQSAHEAERADEADDVAPEAAQKMEESPDAERARTQEELREAEAAVAAAEHEFAARLAQVEQARSRSEATRARVEKARADLATAEAEDELALEAVTTAAAARKAAEAAVAKARGEVDRLSAPSG